MKAISHAGFFVLRTPTLPWDTIEGWTSSLEASAPEASADFAAAFARDEARLRERLRAIVARPEVLAAIGVASPGLRARLEPWLRGDETEAALAVEPAVVRYVMRMAGRATPFGLFAGCGVGRLGPRTSLPVPPPAAQARRTRLDTDVLVALAARLSQDRAARAYLRFRTNATAREWGGRLRYCAARLAATPRSYRTVDVAKTPELDAALVAARHPSGATLDEIARAVVHGAEGLPLEDAVAYVHGLVDVNILCASLATTVTGGDELDALIAQLGDVPPLTAARSTLQSVRTELARIDADGFAENEARHERIATELRTLIPDLDTTRLFHVDLLKADDAATLAPRLADEGARAIEILARMLPDRETAMDRFARDFEARYQGREVPLLEALDPEAGVRFGGSGAQGVDASPLLDGLALHDPPERRVPWSARDDLLLAKLVRAAREGAIEIELSARDVEEMSRGAHLPFPPGLAAVVAVAAASPEALAAGDYRLHVQGAIGATVGVYFGRFLRIDPALLAHVEPALRAEEACDEEALHAEIAHVPEKATGSVVTSRPVLRAFEIPVLGGAGAPVARQLPLDDLLVSVRGGRVRLRSRAHGKRVVPHLTCAHSVHAGGFPIYRFLASLEGQGVTPALTWSWGGLSRAPFLPRVRHGKLVLSLAQWNVEGEPLSAMATLRGADRWSAVQRWRAKLALPRHVRLVDPDSDNTLPVDLDNALSVESFLHVARRHPSARLVETFPAPGELVASGPDGAYHHEIVIPYLRARPRAPVDAREPPSPRARLAEVKAIVPPSDRGRRPGDDWLFAKLYCGVATADRVLVHLAPTLLALKREGLVDRWFFIRYGDPEWHLRIRLRGDPDALWREGAPRFLAATSSVRALVSKVVLDTYDPETERYGGDEALSLAERFFTADSEAALPIVERWRSDLHARWRLALVGMDALLDDLGLTLDAKRSTVLLAREGQAVHFSQSAALTRQLGERYRKLRPELDDLLARPSERYAAGVAALHDRGAAARVLGDDLRALDVRGALSAPLTAIATSYLHMWANRVLRGSANAQELVLYDFLARTYQGRMARTTPGARRAS